MLTCSTVLLDLLRWLRVPLLALLPLSVGVVVFTHLVGTCV